MKPRANNLTCTFCYRRRPRRFMKHDEECQDAQCDSQHWKCRSERDCEAAMKRKGII